MRKEEEEKKNKREMAEIASKKAKEVRNLKKNVSTTLLVEDNSEDVIETMLETLQSGGGHQVFFRLTFPATHQFLSFSKIPGIQQNSALEILFFIYRPNGHEFHQIIFDYSFYWIMTTLLIIIPLRTLSKFLNAMNFVKPMIPQTLKI